MPEFVRHMIDLAEMRPGTTAAVVVAAVLYIGFMLQGPRTR